MNANIKIFSPNIKKENFVITNQQSPLNINYKSNRNLNNKVHSFKNINGNQNTANGNTNNTIINGILSIFYLSNLFN